MGIWEIASITAHATVLLGSVLLFRTKRTVPVFTMVLGAAIVLVSETVYFMAYHEYLSESWLYYLGWGLPRGSTSMGWFVFATGLLFFAILHGRNRESHVTDHGAARVA